MWYENISAMGDFNDKINEYFRLMKIKLRDIAVILGKR